MKIVSVFFMLFLFLRIAAQENVADYLIKKGSAGKNTFAIIIADEDYQSYAKGYTENEELAIYQAERFQQMLIKQVKVSKENIIFYPDATNAHIKLAIAKLEKVLASDSKIIFYFHGKTFTSEANGELFLVPVDAEGEETFFMFGVEDLQKRLGNLKSKSVDIFIDAVPGKISASQCILDNGFVKLPESASSYKNQSVFLVQPPVTKPEPEKPAVHAVAVKPVIMISTPAKTSSETYESTCIISGDIKSDCPIMVVAVNGEEASFKEDGTFIARVALSEGDNNISIEAKNCAGWSRDYIIISRLSLPVDTISEKKEIESIQNEEASILKPEGKNYALLIGVSQYKDAMMPNLFYPLKDAQKIKDVLLSRYSFDAQNAILLQNPEKEKIVETLDSLCKLLKPEDSFLMFYAGHGSWDEKSRMGYWLPSDAAASVVDNWIMNSIITGFMSVIPAKHVLVIADACFSGSIFRTRAFLPAEEKTIAGLYEKSSKKAMTSGDMTVVPDESIFMKYFVQKLEENTDKYVSAEQLFFAVKPEVANIIDLIPQFGIIKNAGDEGGDYIFFRK